MRRHTVYLHETDMFKAWLKEKGYAWPYLAVDQQSMMAEFQREGLESIRRG